ncbi:MAG: cellulose synthase operon protein YhjQ [Azospirillum brasilense]|nr:MAG: cellulose synthase operon protein YhjQ [Azospirillum brasilense]
MPLICMASPKGGVGKTTLAANIAHSLSRAGRRVLVMDFDPQNALRLHFGMPLGDQLGWASGMPDRSDWHRALRQTASGVALLPFGMIDLAQALALDGLLGRQPELLLGPMRAMLADETLLIIADLPPGPSRSLALLAPLANLVVCVLKAEAMSAALMPEVESGRFSGIGMGTVDTHRLRVVINEVDLQSRLSRAAAEAVARHAGWRLLGAVSRDEAVMESLACQRLVADQAPQSRAANDLREVALAIGACIPVQQQSVPAGMWGGR